jgi:hypothetical protein
MLRSVTHRDSAQTAASRALRSATAPEMLLLSVGSLVNHFQRSQVGPVTGIPRQLRALFSRLDTSIIEMTSMVARPSKCEMLR